MTRAMELVAATKMRKAQDRALRARPYAKEAVSLLSRIVALASLQEVEGTLWKKREQGKVCLVVITSDKGLSGSFNSAVLRLAFETAKGYEAKGETVEVAAVGKKARDFFLNRNFSVAASFLRFSDIVGLQDALPLADWVLEQYRKGAYKEVVFCSTQFVSALLNHANVRNILPLDAKELGQEQVQTHERILEPSSKEIFETLSEELVRVLILHLLYESNASEHSSRMVAMKNATENATDLLESLTLELNKARQSAITQELAEVTGAKEALTAD